MVFRRDNKGDSFQRQISALRQQLGSEDDEGERQASGADTDVEQTERVPNQPEQRRSFTDRDTTFSFGDFGSTPVPTPSYDEGVPQPLSSSLPAPRPDSQTSVIDHDTTWKGDLETAGSIHVHGRLEGSVSASEDVFIGEEADVEASVVALNVIVAGRLRGSIRCGGRFEVLPAGRVTADVQAPALVVHDGAIIAGQVRMKSNESDASPPSDPASKPASMVQRRAGQGR